MISLLKDPMVIYFAEKSYVVAAVVVGYFYRQNWDLKR